MTRLLYVDTGALLALLRPRDAQHARVAEHFRTLRSERARFVTSDAVVGETATRLRYDSGPQAVQTFRNLLDSMVEEGSLIIWESDPGIRAKVFDLIARYRDLSLSYADCVGAVVARAERIDSILGLDQDFRVLGFALEP